MTHVDAKPTVADPKSPRGPACADCLFATGVMAGDPTAGAVCERATSRKLNPREVLFREGEAATGVYTVRSGQVKIVTVDTTGREHVLAVFGPGEMLGLDTLHEGIHNVTAVALRSAQVCSVPKADMVEALKHSPQLGKYMTQRLIGQLREARALQVCLGTVRSTAKVAAWLARHIRRCEDGLLCVPRTMTLADLAGVVGLAQETACRALMELERDGCIRGEHKRWVVTNKDGLVQAGHVRIAPPRETP